MSSATVYWSLSWEWWSLLRTGGLLRQVLPRVHNPQSVQLRVWGLARRNSGITSFTYDVRTFHFICDLVTTIAVLCDRSRSLWPKFGPVELYICTCCSDAACDPLTFGKGFATFVRGGRTKTECSSSLLHFSALKTLDLALGGRIVDSNLQLLCWPWIMEDSVARPNRRTTVKRFLSCSTVRWNRQTILKIGFLWKWSMCYSCWEYEQDVPRPNMWAGTRAQLESCDGTNPLPRSSGMRNVLVLTQKWRSTRIPPCQQPIAVGHSGGYGLLVLL